jgi:uncharacterized membrane protein YbhN (UPF0104 family)
MLDANSRRQYLTIAGMVILIVYLLVTLIDIGRVVELIGIAEKDELLLGIGLLIVSYGLISVRWRYLLGNRTGYLHTLKVDTSGYMLSILMQIPNAAYRVVAISKTADVKMSRATSAMVVDFLVGTTLRFIVLILVVVLIIGDVGGESSSLFFGAGILALLLGLLFGLVSRGEQIVPISARMLRRVPRVSEERAEHTASSVIGSFSRVGSPRQYFAAFLLTGFSWAAAFAFYLLTITAFNLDLGIANYLVALAALVIAPPSSPLMIGVFHGLMIASLVGLGLMNNEVATAYALLLHAFQMIILVLLGAWGLSRLDMNLREVLAETRQRRQSGGEQDA